MKALKYFDLFGVQFNFYVGNKRKLYTSYGGIISIVFIFFCLGIFFLVGIKDLLYKNPISNISTDPKAGYHKVKFNTEKLWIPWRIIDFYEKPVNFNNILYPKIYYYKGNKKNINDGFKFETNYIKYKLCNETDFAQRGNNYYIDVPLEKLYCMEIENVELGGGWTSDFMNYIELNIFLCKEGIHYDESNNNCTTFDKLKENFADNITWAFEYFYPIVEFQPTNYENPVIVVYKSHFYNFNRYLNKNERIYIQQYILSDDKSLIFNNEVNSSFWGYISSDFDITAVSDPLIQTSSSTLFSLNIFLDQGKEYYIRRYNKILTIIADAFPIFNIVFFVFNSSTYMIKTIMTEKYLSELFFERIEEKPDKIILNKNKRKSEGVFLNRKKIDKIGNKIIESRINSKNENNYNETNNEIFKSNTNDSNYMNIKKNNLENIKNIKKKIPSSKDVTNNNSSYFQFINPKINNYFVDFRNQSNLINENNKNNYSFSMRNKFPNNNLKNLNNTIQTKRDEYNFEKSRGINNSYSHIFKNKGLNNSAIITHFSLKSSLFSMKDYIYSYFIKAVRAEYKFLSKEFSIIFNFLSNVYDISSYLQLYKQFHILSGYLLDHVADIDINNKININNKTLFKQITLKNKNVFYFALKEKMKNNLEY